jgi:GTP-binding protein Era
VINSGFKSGFVAIIGRPNVGKSTLLNTLVGQKIASISDKPQTTRNRIQGILTNDDFQIIFLDTPGMHKPKHLLGEYMVNVARRAMEEVDGIIFVVDPVSGIGGGDQYIADYIRNIETPKILVLNKIDVISSQKAKEYEDALDSLGEFHKVIKISALRNINTGKLIDELIGILPEGPMYYPADMVTDHPERFIIAELIREKVLELTRDEVPHSVAVDVQEMKSRHDKDLVSINALIYVERDSQKGIIVGKGGQMLKEIGMLARLDIEALLGSRVYLDLWVKVKRNWREDEKSLRMFGYE